MSAFVQGAEGIAVAVIMCLLAAGVWVLVVKTALEIRRGKRL